jgi:DnaJ-class molecular chaperone
LAAWATFLVRIFGRGRREDARAEALEALVEVPFRVAMLGGKVPVTLPVDSAVRDLRRVGAAPGAKVSTCQGARAGGRFPSGRVGLPSIGRVRSAAAAGRCRRRLPDLPGTGGSARRAVMIVPPLTENGSKVRLKGQGQPGRGAPRR